LGIERCGKRKAVNSLSDNYTGIGVVAGFAAVVLIREGPHVWESATHWKIELLHILQEVSGICKTRNQLQRMRLAKSRKDTSTFYFDSLFLASLRSGYLKRLDWEFALHL
jgi:hypothetical protein